MSLLVCESVSLHVSLCLSVCVCICVPVSLFLLCMCLCGYLSICVCVRLRKQLIEPCLLPLSNAWFSQRLRFTLVKCMFLIVFVIKILPLIIPFSVKKKLRRMACRGTHRSTHGAMHAGPHACQHADPLDYRPHAQACCASTKRVCLTVFAIKSKPISNFASHCIRNYLWHF